MKKTPFTEEQMVTILRDADTRPVPEVSVREQSAEHARVDSKLNVLRGRRRRKRPA